MEILVVIVLSLAAGWLVNIAADALPERKSFTAVWRQPVAALGCAFGRPGNGMMSGTEGECDRVHTLRTLATWIIALALGCLAYMQLETNIEAGIVALYAWYLLAIAIIDLEHRRVLNRMLLAALPVVVLVILFTGMPSMRSAILGAMIGFGVFLLTAMMRPGGMGMGDVKLAGLIGLATGVAGVTVSLVVGIMAGGVAGAILMVSSRFDRKATMAYAPYLALGAWVALYAGADMQRFYLN